MSIYGQAMFPPNDTTKKEIVYQPRGIYVPPPKKEKKLQEAKEKKFPKYQIGMVLLAILCYAVSFYLMPLLDIIPVPGPMVATEHLGPGLGKN